MKLHINYCNSFGISEPEIQATEELQGKPPLQKRLHFLTYDRGYPACTAYTRYVLDVGQSEDWLALQMALAPCLLGYGAVAKMLHAHAETVREGNTYWDWIENYNADDYVEAVRLGSGAYCPLVRFKFDVRLTLMVAVELIEKNIRLQSPSRIEELIKIFVHATKVSF